MFMPEPKTWAVPAMFGSPRLRIDVAAPLLSVLRLPGTTGNYASTPDSAALDITGDIDLRCAVALDDWTPAGRNIFISKWNGGQSHIFELLSSGALRLFISEDGANAPFADSTAVIVAAAAELVLVRVIMDADDGAGGHTVTFYVKTGVAADSAVAELKSDAGWTQLGNVLQDPFGVGTTSIFAGSANLEIGARNNGLADFLDGDAYAALVISGLDVATGTIAFDADFTVQAPGTISFTEDSVNAAIVTINQSGSPQAEIVSVES